MFKKPWRLAIEVRWGLRRYDDSNPKHVTRRRRVSARRRRAHGIAICGFSLITQKLRHFYFRHVVFFHPLGAISFDFKHFEKKNF